MHGEANEMSRLKAALIREYEDDPEYNIDVYNPRNTQAVEFYFRGEKMAKVSPTISITVSPVVTSWWVSGYCWLL